MMARFSVMDMAESLEEGRRLAETESGADFPVTERHVFEEAAGDPDNELALGDNLAYMRWLLDRGYAGRVQCIYIDPPFFTNATYDAVVTLRNAAGERRRIRHLAYDDTFERSLGHYVRNMTARLCLVRELLAEDGLLWVHLDWHAVHYIKLVLDELFGYDRFVNEIIWKYKSGGSSKRHFSRKHDSLLLYSKSKSYFLDVPREKSYNRGLKPYRFKGVQEYEDAYGWYTLVHMKDVWSIDMVGRTAEERNGYATQKPQALMRRILAASTRPGDLVADFFCGSGTFLTAADTMDRRWLGCDSERLAIGMARKRLDAGEASYLLRRQEGREIHDGQLRIEHCVLEALPSGKSLYRGRLAAFRPVLDYGHVPMGDRAFVEELERTAPERLIDYILIDPDYRGSFSVEMSVTEHFEDMRFLSRGNMAYIVVDVFGREYGYYEQ